MSRVSCYCIYGICGSCEHSLLIDYVDESIHTNETDILQQHCTHQALSDWQIRHHLQISEAFELEKVFSKEAAEEAVSFWKAYFISLGETVIEDTHVGEVSNEN